jgi:transposase
MQSEKHQVHLSEVERKRLLAIISKGRNKAVVIQRAHILLKVDEGKTDGEISEVLYVSEQTIRRTRLRFATENVEAALEDKPHPPKEVKLNEKEEAYLIALACSEPPAGQVRWTLEMLTKQLRLLLKKTV